MHLTITQNSCVCSLTSAGPSFLLLCWRHGNVSPVLSSSAYMVEFLQGTFLHMRLWPPTNLLLSGCFLCSLWIKKKNASLILMWAGTHLLFIAGEHNNQRASHPPPICCNVPQRQRHTDVPLAGCVKRIRQDLLGHTAAAGRQKASGARQTPCCVSIQMPHCLTKTMGQCFVCISKNSPEQSNWKGLIYLHIGFSLKPVLRLR